MGNETLVFSLLTALVGMSIVFAFLALLSILMSFIKILCDKAGKYTERVRGFGAEKESMEVVPALDTITNTSEPEWVAIAVSVFLLLEKGSGKLSAAGWRPSEKRCSDPWIVSSYLQD